MSPKKRKASPIQSPNKKRRRSSMNRSTLLRQVSHKNLNIKKSLNISCKISHKPFFIFTYIHEMSNTHTSFR